MVAVAQINFFNDPQGRAPAQLLRDWPTLRTTAEAAAGAGDKVSVIQSSVHTQCLTRGGIDYHCLPLDREPALLRHLLERLRPQVLHVHGLGFVQEVLALSGMAPGRPIVLQDHADRPPRRPWHWPFWRRGLSAARGLMFCAREQALPFTRRGLVRARTRIYEVPESSCRFRPMEQAEARRATGLAGEPCLLWVGHLSRGKDPLTVLDGVASVVQRLPGLQLWCCFGSAPLRAEVEARIRSNPLLTDRVHLLGSVPHAQIEVLMSAADFLVQGSHHEGSGYSVIESLACGLPPLVTDIPSFRALTGRGAAGHLWPPGQPQALARAVLQAAALPMAPQRAAALACFEAHNSVGALGRKLSAVYADLLAP